MNTYILAQIANTPLMAESETKDFIQTYRMETYIPIHRIDSNGIYTGKVSFTSLP
jgi:hypothetical protein